MNRNNIHLLNLTIGALLALAAVAFGVAGFIAGLADASRGWGPHAGQWYLAAIVLALAAGALALEDVRERAHAVDVVLGDLLVVLGLGLGTVGFILGMANKDHVATWQLSAIVPSVLGLTAMTDNLRLHAARLLDPFAGMAALFGLLAAGMGVVGFILGVGDRAYVDTWLNGAIVSSIVALGLDFIAEHRAVLQREEERPAPRAIPHRAA